MIEYWNFDFQHTKCRRVTNNVHFNNLTWMCLSCTLTLFSMYSTLFVDFDLFHLQTFANVWCHWCWLSKNDNSFANVETKTGKKDVKWRGPHRFICEIDFVGQTTEISLGTRNCNLIITSISARATANFLVSFTLTFFALISIVSPIFSMSLHSFRFWLFLHSFG